MSILIHAFLGTFATLVHFAMSAFGVAAAAALFVFLVMLVLCAITTSTLSSSPHAQ